MIRRIIATIASVASSAAAVSLGAIIGVTILMAASSNSAEAAYRIEHARWGNEDLRFDRIYVRDPASGKRLVLSQHWGSACNRRGALNYGFGGGCWYPVKEKYATWRDKP